MRIAKRAILIASPMAWCTIVTVIAAVLSQMAVTTNPAFSGERVSKSLKLDANGEPCEVTLSDGTVLKLETYGNEYEAYEYRSPIRAEEGQVIIDYNRMNRSGVQGGGIKLDLKHGKMYWGEWPHSTWAGSSILRANLDGSNIQFVVNRHPLRPSAHTLDLEGGKIYWTDSGKRNGEGRRIERANLDGSNPKIVVPRLTEPAGIAIDRAANKLFYFDERNLIASSLDGKDEKRLSVQVFRGELLVDHSSQMIYWATAHHLIRRTRFDGTETSDVVNVGEAMGKIRHIALDSVDRKIYWTHESAQGHIRRANLDGSQIEDIVVGINGPTGLALDLERRVVYWTESNPGEKGIGNVRILRAKLPPAPKPTSQPAPPWVIGIAPQQQSAGGEIILSGGCFADTEEVLFVDDSSGAKVNAQFTKLSDRQLSVRIPRMGARCRHPLIIVRGRGGLTVALPRSVRVAHRDAVDRFHPDDQFAYVAPSGSAIGIDRGAVVAFRGAVVTGNKSGSNTLFLKNGTAVSFRRTPNNFVFCEPFALISKVDEVPKDTRFVRVPAIRPSFLEEPFEYEHAGND